MEGEIRGGTMFDEESKLQKYLCRNNQLDDRWSSTLGDYSFWGGCYHSEHRNFWYAC